MGPSEVKVDGGGEGLGASGEPLQTELRCSIGSSLTSVLDLSLPKARFLPNPSLTPVVCVFRAKDETQTRQWERMWGCVAPILNKNVPPYRKFLNAPLVSKCRHDSLGLRLTASGRRSALQRGLARWIRLRGCRTRCTSSTARRAVWFSGVSKNALT